MALLANRRSVMSLYAEATDPCSHAVRFVLSEKAINVEIQFVSRQGFPTKEGPDLRLSRSG